MPINKMNLDLTYKQILLCNARQGISVKSNNGVFVFREIQRGGK